MDTRTENTYFSSLSISFRDIFNGKSSRAAAVKTLYILNVLSANVFSQVVSLALPLFPPILHLGSDVLRGEGGEIFSNFEDFLFHSLLHCRVSV